MISCIDIETFKAKIPMVVTNQTYNVVGSMFPTKEMGGGSGLKIVIFYRLSIKEERERWNRGNR